MSPNNEIQDKAEGAALVAGGTVAGAGVAATVGGMGLVGGFGGVAIGSAPVVAAGSVVGSAAYGAKKAMEEGDATALGAVAAGAAAGSLVAGAVGNMGLAVGGTAIAIGSAPVIAAGAVVGLAAYGMLKIFNQADTTNNKQSNLQTLADITREYEEKRREAVLEIDAELEALKAQIQAGINLSKD